jgi:cation transport regulator ChaC
MGDVLVRDRKHQQRHQPVSAAEAPSPIALFAYGSLASVASAGRTLGRPVEHAAVARLPGWRRRWSQVRDNRITEKTFAHAESGVVPPHCLGLNLEPDSTGNGPNGVLLEISEEDLDRLVAREIRYEVVDVTDAMRTGDARGFARVVTFTAKPENFAPTPPPGAVILAPYLRAVEAAFGSIGSAELDLFRETTGAPPVKIIDAVLVRDEIPAGNPRDW